MSMMNFLRAGLSVCLFASHAIAATDVTQADPPLALWVEQTLVANPALQASRAAVDAARSRTVAAGKPLYNPDLALDYEDAETRAGFVELSQTIDWADKRGARASVSDYELEAANAAFELARQDLASRLLNGLSEYHSAIALEELAGKRQELMDQFANLATRRYKAGELGTTDYLVQLDQALNTRVSALEVRGRLWSAWFDWLRASGRVLKWLGDEDRIRRLCAAKMVCMSSK